MIHRRTVRHALVAALLTLSVAPSAGLAFVESTTTEGEITDSLSGVWLVVSRIEFQNPSPAPTPAGKTDAGAQDSQRYVNAPNILKIVHLPKSAAQIEREADAKRLQASVDRAKALIAEDAKRTIPMQTETGTVEGEAKVLVPTIPPIRMPGEGDDVDVFLLDVKLPKAIDESLQKAALTQSPWTPSAEDLKLLGASWNKLEKTPPPGEFSKVEWKVTAKEKFDEQMQNDPMMQGARVVITGNQEIIPGPGRPTQNIIVFAARDIGADKIEGKHVRAMMAGAPFPMPIEMKGNFTMYKVAEVPKDAKADDAKTAAAKTADEKKAAQ
jgi:hypothetical protein